MKDIVPNSTNSSNLSGSGKGQFVCQSLHLLKKSGILASIEPSSFMRKADNHEKY